MLICGVDDVAHILYGLGERVGGQQCEAVALAKEMIPVPFINGTGEMCRAAELLFVARNLAGLDLADDRLERPGGEVLDR